MNSLECWIVDQLLPLCGDAEMEPRAAEWVRRHQERCAGHEPWAFSAPAPGLSAAEERRALARLGDDFPAEDLRRPRAAGWLGEFAEELRASPVSEAAAAIMAAVFAWAVVLPARFLH